MLIPALATVAVACGVGLASRADMAGTPAMLLFAFAPYALFGAASLARLARLGEAHVWLAPRQGDVTFGAIVGALLFSAALVGRSVIAPHPSAREGWLVRAYLQLGEPAALQQRYALVCAALLALAALAELTWRAMVFPLLAARFGARVAFPATAALFALAHAPTIWLLRDPAAGPNPLIVLAALGTGLVVGAVVARTERLPVAILGHALFLCAVVVGFPLWRLGA